MSHLKMLSPSGPAWQRPEWVADAVFYEIFVDRFANGDTGNDPPETADWRAAPTPHNFSGGDLQGIIDHLPYLQELGVSALYLTPIFRARTNHRYDTCDYLMLDPAVGDEALLRALVEQAHSRGMRIILDGVFNHCGDGFWAFEDVKQKGAASPYASWFSIDSFPVVGSPPNYQTCGGTEYLPKFNLHNPQTRDYLLSVGSHWLDYGIDGWRLDVPWKAPIEFWHRFRREVKRAHPEAYLVGEIWRDASPWLRGDTFDGVMNYALREALLDFCVRETMDAEDFDHEVRHLLDVHGPCAPYQLNLLGSHDTPRLLTLCGDDVERGLVAATALFSLVGVPMVYYGDEIGLHGGNDPECRRPMPWDGAGWVHRLHETYRNLIRIRHEHSALRRGSLEPLWVRNAVYAFRRASADDEVVVVLNPRESIPQVRIPLGRGASTPRIWKDLLGGRHFYEAEGMLEIEGLPAKAAYLLVPQVETAGGVKP